MHGVRGRPRIKCRRDLIRASALSASPEGGAAPLRQSEDRCAIVLFHDIRRAQPVLGLFLEPGSRALMASRAMAFAFSVLAGPAQRCEAMLFDGSMPAPPASRNKGPRSPRR